MRSFYLAARFSRQAELAGYAARLIGRGFQVTSRWLHAHETDIQSKDATYTERQRMEFAVHDFEDVLAADRLIAFTENPAPDAVIPGRARGGRHVELGVAIYLAHERGHSVYVVGHKENVFCYLPWVNFFPDFDSCLEAL